jgi:hypothetical protein
MYELLKIPVFAAKKKKADRKGHLAWDMDDVVIHKDRSKHLSWSPEDIVMAPDRSRHLVWHKDDIIIHKLGKTEIKSWEASYFPEIENAKTSAHLSTRQKESLENPDHDRVVESSMAHAKTLDDSHHQAVKDYMTSSASLNKSLRAGLPKATPDFKKFEARTKEKLDHVTNHKMPHDTVAYRGVHSSMATIPAGTTFQDKGYTGTSISKKEAEWHAPTEEAPKRKSKEPERSPQKHMARFFIKKGEKGGYLPTAHGEGKEEYDREKELLLPRGQHYKVLGHSKENGVHYIDIEQHHPEGKTEAKASTVWPY